jgi:hypothetical protein
MSRLVCRLACALAAGALAGCATTAPSDPQALDEAHRDVAQALDSTEVNRYAWSELARARDMLARADEAWESRHDADETSHLAYLARRSAELAAHLAAQRAADEHIADASSELERLRADRRTREGTPFSAPRR